MRDIERVYDFFCEFFFFGFYILMNGQATTATTEQLKIERHLNIKILFISIERMGRSSFNFMCTLADTHTFEQNTI